MWCYVITCHKLVNKNKMLKAPSLLFGIFYQATNGDNNHGFSSSLLCLVVVLKEPWSCKQLFVLDDRSIIQQFVLLSLSLAPTSLSFAQQLLKALIQKDFLLI